MSHTIEPFSLRPTIARPPSFLFAASLPAFRTLPPFLPDRHATSRPRSALVPFTYFILLSAPRQPLFNSTDVYLILQPYTSLIQPHCSTSAWACLPDAFLYPSTFFCICVHHNPRSKPLWPLPLFFRSAARPLFVLSFRLPPASLLSLQPSASSAGHIATALSLATVCPHHILFYHLAAPPFERLSFGTAFALSASRVNFFCLHALPLRPAQSTTVHLSTFRLCPT